MKIKAILPIVYIDEKFLYPVVCIDCSPSFHITHYENPNEVMFFAAVLSLFVAQY